MPLWILKHSRVEKKKKFHQSSWVSHRVSRYTKTDSRCTGYCQVAVVGKTWPSLNPKTRPSSLKLKMFSCQGIRQSFKMAWIRQHWPWPQISQGRHLNFRFARQVFLKFAKFFLMTNLYFCYWDSRKVSKWIKHERDLQTFRVIMEDLCSSSSKLNFKKFAIQQTSKFELSDFKNWETTGYLEEEGKIRKFSREKENWCLVLRKNEIDAILPDESFFEKLCDILSQVQFELFKVENWIL